MAAPRGRFAGRLDGLEASLTMLKTYADKAPEIMDGIMHDWADEILRKAKEYAPESLEAEEKLYGKATEYHGYLRDSGGVIKNDEMNYSVVFTAWYAVYVHEIMRHHTVGSWQYLSRAVSEALPKMIAETGMKFQSSISGMSTGRGFFTATFGRGGPVVSNRMLK